MFHFCSSTSAVHLIKYFSAYINFLSADVVVHASVPRDNAGLAYFLN
jgi:hypothetical protein